MKKLKETNSNSKEGGAKSIEEIYQKKSQLEHILLRPDTYIGSIETTTNPMWIYENDKLVYRNINYVPGLYKIFDELIVNAADNKQRDKNMDTIKVTIDRENNLISVYNNGRGIPIEMHKEEGVYVPELIFGHLLTSSNYDDTEKKVTGGRNGYGAKVETAESGKKYKQVFTNNMGTKGTPVITKTTKDDDHTKISFKPDLQKFGLSCLDEDLEALMKKRVYDLAGCVRGVNVYLNGNRIKIKDFKAYIELYVNSTTPETEGAVSRPAVIYERIGDRWEVGVTTSDSQFQQVSFVNSICTSKGGTHVNHVADQIVTSLIEAVKKKEKKGAPVKPFQVKNHLWIFVNTLIENPSFDSQTKENMTLKISSFGSKCVLTDEFQKKVLKSGVVENILSDVRMRQEKALKKQDGHKTTRISGITKLDDANNAGTRNASKCTLILTEGDSAKSLAVSGLSVIGRDNFGVFPLRGKLLNVREASHSQISGNAEITAIKQILGLQHGKSYTSTETLRYGHLMIMTDQDHDGSHIKGLIINFLDHFWPSLLKIPNFLVEFITPIVKVTKGKDKNKREHSFFTIPEYEKWKRENDDAKGWAIKYYKGLGTSTTEDARKYFSDMTNHRKPFSVCDDSDRALIDMAFNKKKADDRKEWLRNLKPGTFMDHTISSIPLSDFINKELILFSMADNIRSIPSIVDGLKPGQRKIMYACFKRKLSHEIKVAQLAGYVAEHSAYHHGEVSLCSTIVNLAQNYVGSNNLNMLEPIGQFGTRLQGGKDAASARYIFTCLTPLARCIFNQADDTLLKYLNDDGQNIEPEWYMPILPMVLVNGAEGIGTGYSTNIPNFNPRDIAKNLLRYMDGKPVEKMHPWYRSFKGEILSAGPDKYKVTGLMNKIDANTIEIVELPIRSWTQTYKEMLEEYLVGTEKSPSSIKDYKEYHTDSSVHFVISMSDEQMQKAEAEGLEKKFKLSTSISTSNMVCFDAEGRIRKYENVDCILEEFYSMRMKYYKMRKEHLLDMLTMEWTKLENKVRFIEEIISGELIIQNRKKIDIVSDLKNKEYAPMKRNVDASTVSEEQGDNDVGGYDYLLGMPLWSLTWERVQHLMKERTEKAKEIDYLTSQSAQDLWRTDLSEFMIQFDLYEQKLEENESHGPVKKGKKVGKSKAKKLISDDESEISEAEFEVKKKPKAVVKKEDKPKTVIKKEVITKKEAPIKKIDEDEPFNGDDILQKKGNELKEKLKMMMNKSSSDPKAAMKQTSLVDFITKKPAPVVKKMTKQNVESDEDMSFESEISESFIEQAPVKKTLPNRTTLTKNGSSNSSKNTSLEEIDVTYKSAPIQLSDDEDFEEIMPKSRKRSALSSENEDIAPKKKSQALKKVVKKSTPLDTESEEDIKPVKKIIKKAVKKSTPKTLDSDNESTKPLKKTIKKSIKKPQASEPEDAKSVTKPVQKINKKPTPKVSESEDDSKPVKKNYKKQHASMQKTNTIDNDEFDSEKVKPKRGRAPVKYTIENEDSFMASNDSTDDEDSFNGDSASD